LIAEDLRADGFTYSKSKGTLQRTSKEQNLVFQIVFQSSHQNKAGKLVVLWVHGHVLSPALKVWRATHPCLRRGSDLLAGGQIGNLVEPPSWMEWNLADASMRGEEIENVISTIRMILFPFFQLFDRKEDPLSLSRNSNLLGIQPADILDLLMCYGSRTDTANAAQNMLEKLPSALVRYPSALAQFREEGLPPYTLTNYGEVLAAATILFDLHFKTGATT
jgi:hypothetical protein